MRSLRNAALSAVVVAGWSQAALADPLSFIWNPSNAGLGLPATDSISATGLEFFHYADIVINVISGGFTENGVLAISGFSGASALPSGLNTNYSFYLTFNDAGVQRGTPEPGQSVSGTFATLNYTVWASMGAGVSVTVQPGGIPIITGQGITFPLFYGSLVPGTGTLTLRAPTSGGYIPSATAKLTVRPCTAANQTTTTGATCTGDETGFFNPTNGTIMAINVSGDGVSVFTPPFTPAPYGTGEEDPFAWLDINGSTLGTVDFQAAAPEPGTLMLLASGIMALGVVGSRRKRG
jgi:hypothetical protein